MNQDTPHHDQDHPSQEHELSDQAMRGKWIIKGVLILGLGLFGLLSGLPMLNGQPFHSASLSPSIVFFAFWMGVWLGHQWARYVLAALMGLIGGYQIIMAVDAFTSSDNRQAMVLIGVAVVPFTLALMLVLSKAIGVYQQERNIQRWGSPTGKAQAQEDPNLQQSEQEQSEAQGSITGTNQTNGELGGR